MRKSRFGSDTRSRTRPVTGHALLHSGFGLIKTCWRRNARPLVYGIVGWVLRQPVAVIAQQRRVDKVWQEIANRWGILTAEQVAQVTGLNVHQAGENAEDYGHKQGILGTRRDGQPAFPAWQLATRTPGESTSRVHAQWILLQAPLIAAGWSPEEILIWAASPSGRLAGSACPVDLLNDDPASAIQAAIDAAHGPPG